MIPSTSTPSESDPKICRVCGSVAHSFNYGALTCDACKMFFRRYTIARVALQCHKDGQCYRAFPPRRCRACRLEKCVSSGMSMDPSQIREVRNVQDDWRVQMVSRLLEDDAIRENNYLNMFTHEDPSFVEIVQRGSRLLSQPKDPRYEMRIVDWCFMNALTGIHFLLNLRFMKGIDNRDKRLLLKSFYIKSSLMFWSFRMFLSNNETLQTPEREEIYPDSIGQINPFTPARVNEMRKKPVASFRDLQVTREEMMLLLVILFCNPVLQNLSTNAVEIVAHQQKLHNSALLHYCQLKYQDSAPSRLTDLLSITHLMIKNEKDVELVCMMLRIAVPDYQVQKLVCNEA